MQPAMPTLSASRRFIVLRACPGLLTGAALFSLTSCHTATTTNARGEEKGTFAASSAYTAIPAGIRAEIKAAKLRDSLPVRGRVRMIDQVLKVANLSFYPNSALEVEALGLDWIAIFAKVLNIDGPASIERTSRFNLDGEDGRDGRNAPQYIGETGRNGLNGQDGEQAGDGKSLDVPEVFLFAQDILIRGAAPGPTIPRSEFSLMFDGYPGGKGGTGGRGGNGSNGERGTPSRNGIWIDCSDGPGRGGDGGSAGRGGLGGRGGDGGDARNVYLFTTAGRAQSMNSIYRSQAGGVGGEAGETGANGSPGQPGPEGRLSSHCGTAGRGGRPAPALPPCAPGRVRGRPGVASDPLNPIVLGVEDFQDLT